MVSSKTGTRSVLSTSLPYHPKFTFSAQRAEFTKPVPTTLLPVYPTFARNPKIFDSEDGAFNVDMSTDRLNPQRQLTERERNSLAANPDKLTKKKSEGYSHSFMGRFSNFLGLQKRQQPYPNEFRSTVVLPFTQSPSSASAIQEPTLFPFPSSASSASFHNDLMGENCRNRSNSATVNNNHKMSYESSNQFQPSGGEDGSPKPSQDSSHLPHLRSRQFSLHKRSHSLSSTRLYGETAVPFPVPKSNSRSHSVDLSRYGQMPGHNNSLAPPDVTIPLPPHSVLIQVWAVGVDESDIQSIKWSHSSNTDDHEELETGNQRRKINFSIFNSSTLGRWPLEFRQKKTRESELPVDIPMHFDKRSTRWISHGQTISGRQDSRDIPGKCFVGRILETGSLVRMKFVAKDDWVVGMAHRRKRGPLAKTMIIDWRQIHRVQPPYDFDYKKAVQAPEPLTPYRNPLNEDASRGDFHQRRPLTLTELALLPLCGIPAYRAVRTCLDAFPIEHDVFSAEPLRDQQRRALVLRGHDGAGIMAAQMLVRHGWRVTVHVPFSRVPWDATQVEGDMFMFAIEERLKKLGVDEVIYDDGISYAVWDREKDDRKPAVIRIIETLRREGDVFDAVLDFVGGMEIQEACERLLRLDGFCSSQEFGQFITFSDPDTVDDSISMHSVIHSNLPDATTHHHSQQNADDRVENIPGRRVKYTCIKGMVDEGIEEIWEVLRPVLRLVRDDGIRPQVQEIGGEIVGTMRVVSLEKAYGLLRDGDLFSDGGTAVVVVNTIF